MRQPRYFSHWNDVGWITEIPFPGRRLCLGHHIGGLLFCRLEDAATLSAQQNDRRVKLNGAVSGALWSQMEE
jgi:hypothetical protein